MILGFRTVLSCNGDSGKALNIDAILAAVSFARRSFLSILAPEPFGQAQHVHAPAPCLLMHVLALFADVMAKLCHVCIECQPRFYSVPDELPVPWDEVFDRGLTCLM